MSHKIREYYFHYEDLSNFNWRVQIKDLVQHNKKPLSGLFYFLYYFFTGLAFLATLAFFTLAFGSFLGAFSFLARAFLPL